MDIHLLMDQLGQSGVTVLLKIDDERVAEGGRPWTVVLSGRALGEQGYIRAESRTLENCLDQVLSELRARSGDWDWVADLQ